MKQTKSAGGVVIGPGGNILVVNQHGTSWSLPKGHPEPGEDLLAAARREIYEESGLTELEYVRELGSYQRHRLTEFNTDDVTELKTIPMFLFRTPQAQLRPVDPGNPEALWVAKGEVAKILTHRKDKEFFLSVVETL